MQAPFQRQLIGFLQQELAIPEAEIAIALKHPEQTPKLLPMVLWQYGFMTIEQLERTFDWMEQSSSVEDLDRF